jgi:tRNA(adenine34) deaminase
MSSLRNVFKRILQSRALPPALVLAGIAACLTAGVQLCSVEAAATGPAAEQTALVPLTGESLLQAIEAYKLDSHYRDDAFVLAAVKEAAQGWREHNGGIGACLVREDTGEIVERAHNSQYVPYFRSDLHAEMQLMDRYEDRLKLSRSDPARGKLRDLKGLALYTSVEPCPMCLARLINSGVKKVYYAAPDEQGGMAKYMDALPPYWRQMAAGMTVEPARSSPELNAMAKGLFHPMHPANAAH